jgi:hypothetical protein
MKPRVFFVEQTTRFNSSSALFYGQPVFVTAPGDRIPPFRTDELLDRVHDVLDKEEFDPQRDYVALTGPHAAVALFYAQVLSRYGVCNTLLFDAPTERYSMRTVTSR